MNFPQTPDDSARARLPLELLRGGPNAAAGAEASELPSAREAEIARALEKATSSELSPEAIEALASEAPLIPPREPLGARLANYFGRHQLLLFVLSFFALWGIVVLPTPFADTDLAPELVAPRDIVAPHSAFLPDRTETEKRRAAAAALVTPAYDPNPSALGQALIELPVLARRLRLALHSVRTSQNASANRNAGQTANRNAGANTSQTANQNAGANSDAGRNGFDGVARLAKFREFSGWNVTPATLDALLSVSSARWKTVDEAATGAVRAAYMRGRIRSDVAPDAEGVRPLLRAQIEEFSAQTALSPAEKTAALTLAQRVASVPNVVVNQSKTDDARRDARAAVLPVYTHIEANAPLVRQGERISDAQWMQMQELGVVAPQFAPLTALAIGALCLMLVSGAAAYIGGARREVWQRPAALWLVAVVPIVFLLAFRLILRVPHADFLMIALAATAAMLLTILLDMRLGVPVGFVVAALCALMARVDAQLFLAATLSAWIGALLVARFASRFALLRAILILGVINGFLAGALGILGDAPPDEIISSIAWDTFGWRRLGFGGGGVGDLFGAPVWHHFAPAPARIVVARRNRDSPDAGRGARHLHALADGGEPGRSRRQKSRRRFAVVPRRRTCITTSASCGARTASSKISAATTFTTASRPVCRRFLIKAHVKDGLELGRAIRLPLPVLEIVASHHGTSTVAYFLHRAKQQCGEDGVDEKIYRYPGPKPRSREAAILLLADALEASTRSIPHLTPDGLEAHIEKIVEGRVREGDLGESELSLREIGAIREAFAVMMRGAMHGRIAYPDAHKVATDNDWVAQTLGERKVERRRSNSGKAKGNGSGDGVRNGAKVATNGRCSQNREGRRSQTARLPNASAVAPSKMPPVEPPTPQTPTLPNRRRRHPRRRSHDERNA